MAVLRYANPTGSTSAAHWADGAKHPSPSPYLAAGPAQKHVTVSESLLRLDPLVQPSAMSAREDDELADPQDGDIYILPLGKSRDAWDAMADHTLAYWRDGVWEEIASREGWRAYVCDAGELRVFDGDEWRDVAPEGAFRVLAASAVAVPHTGNMSETTLAPITVPANLLGVNGVRCP